MPEHTIPPVFDPDSKLLILGSFPSVRSREAGFFYAHPQNRFWHVLACLYGKPIPQTIPEKKELLTVCHIALWDVIASCEITGSSDQSIRNVRVNHPGALLAASRIRRIFTNGAQADTLYRTFLLPETGIPATRLPSTSPANAAFSLARLCDAWRVLTEGECENSSAASDARDPFFGFTT